MSRSIRKAILLGATAFALVAAPVLVDMTGPLDLAAYAKDKGNSGKKNAGGKPSDKGGGNAKSAGKPAKVASVSTEAAVGKPEKVKNLNAQLAGLNSLKRNVNGLMNSADPRMEQIRQFVQAGADLEAANAALLEATTTLGTLQATFETYLDTYIAGAGLTAFDGSAAYADPSLTSLTERLALLDAAIAAGTADQLAIDERTALLEALTIINASPELAAVDGQQVVVGGLTNDVANLELATGEDALKAALLAAANANRVDDAGGDAYLTPEIMTWAEAQLGTLTADYIAQQ